MSGDIFGCCNLEGSVTGIHWVEDRVADANPPVPRASSSSGNYLTQYVTRVVLRSSALDQAASYIILA